VAYFHGCATQHYEMEVGQAIVAVLEHNGFEVVLPEQNCCGLPMQSNVTSPKPGATPRRISASWRRTPDRTSPSSLAERAAAWN